MCAAHGPPAWLDLSAARSLPPSCCPSRSRPLAPALARGATLTSCGGPGWASWRSQRRPRACARRPRAGRARGEEVLVPLAAGGGRRPRRPSSGRCRCRWRGSRPSSRPCRVSAWGERGERDGRWRGARASEREGSGSPKRSVERPLTANTHAHVLCSQITASLEDSCAVGSDGLTRSASITAQRRILELARRFGARLSVSTHPVVS